ncbi:GyrI-like domain-containing protein [Fluviicola sp.]|uniref:GyrI-like domain-containing protein n=1 Tax=Fluviicola sp. TaxID=1917219 RepID=UPI00262659AF|nr:GyrI-like domain-containing protein [Fluviicola sp.]
MTKLDLTKEYKAYYTAKNKPELLTIEKASFLSITGKGDPSGQDYAENIQALYSVAYGVKFLCKALGKDFVVPKLEGLWSFDTDKYQGFAMDEAPLKIPRSEWNYRMLIRMPDFVTKEQLEQAIQTVVSKKQIGLAAYVEFYEMEEGKVVQMLHVGPFSDEPETLKQILAFCEEHQLIKNGLHHEIYLSDFRKTAPEKLKTILREPVK